MNCSSCIFIRKVEERCYMQEKETVSSLYFGSCTKKITMKHRTRYTMFVHVYTCHPHLSVCILQIIRISIECFKSIIFSSITVYYRDTGLFSRAAAPL